MSHFIPEPSNFSEVTRLPPYFKKAWLKETLKGIKKLTNNQTFIIDDPEKGDLVTPCMDIYKAKIQPDGSINKLKSSIIVREEFQNKEMIGDIWSPTAPMMNLKYFLSDSAKNKARVHQLYFIGSFLQANVKHIFFEIGDSIWRILPRICQIFWNTIEAE